MAYVEMRPSISNARTLYRHAHCERCRETHWHVQTGPHLWTCKACGTTFRQNPWVSDGHQLIDEPRYEGEPECQRQYSAPTAADLASARPAEDTENTASSKKTATARSSASSAKAPAPARRAMVQVAFL